MAGIEIKGLKELTAQIKDLEQLKGLKAVMLAAGKTLRDRLAVYPVKKETTRAAVYGSAFKSDKQRRYFFYALKNGLLTVPYSRGADPRGERFKASWALETENGGLTITIGNDTTYGPYLMDTGQQSKFMAALGWPTIDKVADDNAEDVSAFVMYETSRLLGLDA